MVLQKAGLNVFPACRTGRDWAFVQGSTFVLRLNFCAKKPAFGNTQTVSVKNNPNFTTTWAELNDFNETVDNILRACLFHFLEYLAATLWTYIWS